MAKLNICQKTIKALFSDRNADFVIPCYKRPYAWREAECLTLWEDLFAFAFPENEHGIHDAGMFDKDKEYCLGIIVMFRDGNGRFEVADGQQRIITLMLLLRAFYSKACKMRQTDMRRLKESIEQCIWKLDEDYEVLWDGLKISSYADTAGDNAELIEILRHGDAPDDFNSLYAKNFRFFQKKIDEYKDGFPECFSKLPKRIMDNCFLIPIETESQDTALQFLIHSKTSM